MDVDAISGLTAEQLRAVLPGFLSSFIGDPAAAAHNLTWARQEVAAWPDPLCHEVLAQLQQLRTGDERLYRALPACRTLSRGWVRDVVPNPVSEGVEHLVAAAAAGPTVIMCNHLSYFDANAADAMLAWSGHRDLADRVVAAAGPKVYQDLFRLVAAACLHTLSVPQSTKLAHTAKLAPRELARRARASLDGAGELLDEGLILLIYPEGSRTRTGRMGSFIKGVHRYLGAAEGVQVVPAAIDGTDRVLPVGETKFQPGPVTLRFGPALHREGAHTRELLARAHGAVADLLPERLRPPADLAPTA